MELQRSQNSSLILEGRFRMQNWQQHLNTDPLPWLLDPENPSIRYWTLTDIFDRPASDPEVQEARGAIAQQPLVKQLFALQHPQGHWGDDETKPYTAEGAVAAPAADGQAVRRSEVALPMNHR
jgi:hypothetical protein